MKRIDKIFITAIILAITFTATIFAQVSIPNVEAVYGGRISAITGIELTPDTTRIFIATESANSLFYADVYSNTTSPVFGAFQEMPGVNAAAGYGRNIQQIAAHANSGYVYFSHNSGLLASHPSSPAVMTIYPHMATEITITNDHLLFLDGPQLFYGTLNASGAFTAGTGSPLMLPGSSGHTSLWTHPVNDTVYVFEAGTSPKIYKVMDKYSALSASTPIIDISPTSLPAFEWNAFGIAPDGRLFIIGQDGNNKWVSYSDDEVTWISFDMGLGGVNAPTISFGGTASAYNVYHASNFSDNKGMPGSWMGFGDYGFETHANDGDTYGDPINDDIVYMTTDQGIGASENGGETIFEIDEGVVAVWIRDLDMSDSKSTGWIAAKSGVRRVNDFLTSPSWTNALWPEGDGSPYYSVEIDQDDTTTVFAGNVRVYKTTNAGGDWSRVFTPEDPPYNFTNIGAYCAAIEVCDYDHNIVMAGFELEETHKGGLFYSTDGGSTWDQILIEAATTGEDVDISDIEFLMEGTDTVAYIGVIYDVTLPQGRSVYKLVKSGSTWIPSQDMDASGTSVGYPITATIYDIDVSMTEDTVFAAGTDATGGHPIAYYKPLSSTALWTPVPVSGFPTGINMVASAIEAGPDTVFVAVDETVYYYDVVGSASWAPYNIYPTGTRIEVMFYDELLVGTDFGLYSNFVHGSGSPFTSDYWQAHLMVQDAGGMRSSDVLTFGQYDGATDGLDEAIGELELPPLPPAGVFDTRFILPVSPPVASKTDYRAFGQTDIEWTLQLQPGGSGYPFTIEWEPADLPPGTFVIADPFGGMLINVNMKEQASLVVDNTAINSLIIKMTDQLTVGFEVQQGWNMVSVPVMTDDMSTGALFPDASSDVYGFNNGYFPAQICNPGNGYWIKFDEPQSFSFSGSNAAQNIPVNAGWNMVGPFDEAVPAAMITSIPAGIIEGDWYGYENGYFIPEMLEPGKGYWIKTNADGELTYDPGAPKTSYSSTGYDFSGNRRLVISDVEGNQGSLYLLSESAGNSYELPPMPPAGVFDVRFASGKYAENISTGEQIINLNPAAYPVKIKVSNAEVTIITDQEMTLADGDEIIIDNPAIKALKIKGDLNPVQYSLSQNYPNPFNPSTTIKFSLPETANVKLVIYNIVGEKVKEIISGEMDAGYHAIEFNAADLSSGVYFYSLRAGDFSQVKKMMLLK